MFVTSYNIQNDTQFSSELKKVASKVGDIRVELGLIANNWRKGNIAHFTLKGAGKYPPLTAKYQKRKDKVAGRRLPILVGAKKGGGESGMLRDSVINKGSKDSILVIGKTSMIMGTSVSYGTYVQKTRKFLFISDSNIKAWLEILKSATARKVS